MVARTARRAKQKICPVTLGVDVVGANFAKFQMPTEQKKIEQCEIVARADGSMITCHYNRKLMYFLGICCRFEQNQANRKLRRNMAYRDSYVWSKWEGIITAATFFFRKTKQKEISKKIRRT